MVSTSLSMIRGKKGFELQFNWLFVIIGGSILLAFFFMLITNYTSTSEEEMGLSSQNEIDSLFRANQAASETQKLIMFDKKISFFCSSAGNDFLSEYYVGNSKVSTSYNYRAIFTPASLESAEIIIKSTPFKSPYNVMPFLYLTNKHIEYVFVGGDRALFSQLIALLPMNSTVHRADSIGPYRNANYDHTVFILEKPDEGLLGDQLVNFGKSTDLGRAYAVVLDSAGSIANSYGSITFYEYGPGSRFNEQGSASFMGQELLAGAIVSHDYELYSCELRKALLRLGFTLELHRKKIGEYSAIIPSCASSYNNMMHKLNATRDALNEEPPALDTAHTIIREIDVLNEYLVRSTECPSMY